MRACRDICHGFKHKDLKGNAKYKPQDKDFNLYREYDWLEALAASGRSPLKYCVAFADGNGIRKFDLFELVEACLNLWRRFHVENALESLDQNEGER